MKTLVLLTLNLAPPSFLSWGELTASFGSPNLAFVAVGWKSLGDLWAVAEVGLP